MNEMETLLIISPHPDDLEIAMGGTIAKAVSQNYQIISLVLTDGRRSPRSFECSDDEMARIRMEEVAQAAQLLGIHHLITLQIDSLQVEANQLRVQTVLTELITKFSPANIYLPHPELDRHATHRLAAQISLATLLTFKTAITCWAYEVWGLFPYWHHTEEIGDFIEQKRAAIECHKSQTFDTNYSEGILGLNRWRAVFADPVKSSIHRYLEAFIRL